MTAGRLLIRRTRVAIRGQVLVSEPKTKAGRREIPLDDALVAVLRRHRTAQGASAWPWETPIRTTTGCSATSWVPPTILRTSIGCSRGPRPGPGCQRSGSTICDTPRHHVARQGVPVRAVADTLGHEDPSVTHQIYTHAMPSEAREAPAARSALLGGA